jgi:hypothetical protein
LERIERQAAERVERLKREVASDPATNTRRRQAAQERAAREATAKVAKARAALERLREEKAAREKTHPEEEKQKSAASVSLSDLEARRMRFPDGAVRAGYNLQTAAVPDKGLILAVKTTDRRNDQNLARPLVDEVARRYGHAPKRALFDEGYAARTDIEALAGHPAGPVTVYMPPTSEKPEAELGPKGRESRHYTRAREPQAVKDWRARMQTEEGRAVFGRRKLIERIHAHYKHRGLNRLTVAGLIKTQAVALWHALANNLMVDLRLRAAAPIPAA